MTTDTLEVTYPGPNCSAEAVASAAAIEKATPGAEVAFFARLGIGVRVGDQHLPKPAAEALLSSGTVKRTNPPPKPKPAPAVIPAAPKPAQE